MHITWARNIDTNFGVYNLATTYQLWCNVCNLALKYRHQPWCIYLDLETSTSTLVYMTWPLNIDTNINVNSLTSKYWFGYFEAKLYTSKLMLIFWGQVVYTNASVDISRLSCIQQITIASWNTVTQGLYFQAKLCIPSLVSIFWGQIAVNISSCDFNASISDDIIIVWISTFSRQLRGQDQHSSHNKSNINCLFLFSCICKIFQAVLQAFFIALIKTAISLTFYLPFLDKMLNNASFSA